MISRVFHPRRAAAAAALLTWVFAAACAPSRGAAPAAELSTTRSAPADDLDAPIALVIHRGAGTILRETTPPERERELRAALGAALHAGHRVLLDGGRSLDAVIAAVKLLEDSPRFNAGRGAVFTSDGRNELDASIMDGASLNAGAVAGVTRVKNPIELARQVMERSPHVMLIGAGAEAFAEQLGLEMVSPDYFHTPARWEALQRARQQETSRNPGEEPHLAAAGDLDEFKLGTVGAVALDRDGNLAAATSTGGMTNKRWGRVGDSPVIGAGTYANNATCAVSATGHGEYFIRNVVAYDICARVEYAGTPLREAADEVVIQKLVAQGATGGVIALDRRGEIAMPFNTPGMYRGFIDPQGRAVVMLYRDDPGSVVEHGPVPALRQGQ